MVCKFALLTHLLLASAALAVLPSLPNIHLARRRSHRQSQPMIHVEKFSDSSPGVEYGSNWAGAAWSENNGTFTTVTGIFNVPEPSGSNGAGAAAWVGIDGYNCQTAIFQTGVEFTITDGEASYEAWYEWYPDPPFYFSGFTINSGDQIKATVTASSTTSGTVDIENLTTGQAITQNATSSYSLCGANAEWIVEDFEETSGLVSFADFGTVTFTSATASGPSGTIYTPSSATVLDIKQNGQVLTSVSTSGNTITIQYV